MKEKKKQFDTKLALLITKRVGTMNTAYVFTVLALFSFPAVLVGVFPSSAQYFPSWLIKASIVALVAWIAQSFLQLVLLPIIMVGQEIQAEHTIKHVKKHIDIKHDHLKKHITNTHKEFRK